MLFCWHWGWTVLIPVFVYLLWPLETNKCKDNKKFPEHFSAHWINVLISPLLTFQSDSVCVCVFISFWILKLSSCVSWRSSFGDVITGILEWWAFGFERDEHSGVTLNKCIGYAITLISIVMNNCYFFLCARVLTDVRWFFFFWI
jgi:hypothetical protein